MKCFTVLMLHRRQSLKYWCNIWISILYLLLEVMHKVYCCCLNLTLKPLFLKLTILYTGQGALSSSTSMEQTIFTYYSQILNNQCPLFSYYSQQKHDTLFSNYSAKAYCESSFSKMVAQHSINNVHYMIVLKMGASACTKQRNAGQQFSKMRTCMHAVEGYSWYIGQHMHVLYNGHLYNCNIILYNVHSYTCTLTELERFSVIH